MLFQIWTHLSVLYNDWFSALLNNPIGGIIDYSLKAILRQHDCNTTPTPPLLLHLTVLLHLTALACSLQLTSYSLKPQSSTAMWQWEKTTTNIQPANLVINPGSASLGQGIQRRLEGRIPLLSFDHTSHLTGPPEAGKRQLWSIKKTNSLVDMNTEA